VQQKKARLQEEEELRRIIEGRKKPMATSHDSGGERLLNGFQKILYM
jgi:hypothetical protein